MISPGLGTGFVSIGLILKTPVNVAQLGTAAAGKFI
jgi:hypothetical protein